MPPKARGGGRGRGRGGTARGRGGSSSTLTGAASSTAAPPELKTEASIANDNDEADGQPATQELTMPEAVESQAADTTNPIPSYVVATRAPRATTKLRNRSTSSPQTVADSPARPPVQRLDSLKSAEPASRSASPAAMRRTASTRGKRPATIKPTFTGRRSKQDREALDKIARDREKERQAERLAEERQKEKDNRKKNRDAQRGNNTRGRGGYSGSVSGPFSLGNASHGKHLDIGTLTVAYILEQTREPQIEVQFLDHEQHESSVRTTMTRAGR
jgi:DNA-directed RNA polymerase III subunit RPC4